MIFVGLYLVFLFLAPQLWVGPFRDLRVDFALYPAWLLYVVVRGRLPELIRFRAQDWLFVGFLIWSAASVVAHGMREEGVDVVFFLVKWFLLYRLTVASTLGRDGIRWTALMLVFFGLVLAVEGIQHYWSKDGLGWAGQALGWVDEAASQVGIERRTRWVNIFDGPGVFCVVFTIALPFVLRYLAHPYSWIVRVAALVPLSMLLLAIYYTGSRGGWITTLLLLAAWFAVRTHISPTKLAVVGVATALFAVGGPAYLTSTRDSSKSAQYRVQMWGEGIEMVQQNPVLGIGRGNFRQYTGRLVAHNSAVEIMGETGVIGFFFWAALAYAACKTLFIAQREAEDEHARSLYRALLFSVGGYLVSAMFVTLEYETYYFLLGLAAAAGNELSEPPSFGRRDATIVLAIMFAFFAALKAFVMIYFA